MTIDIEAAMRPALLTMSNPTSNAATASGTTGRFVSTRINPAAIEATIRKTRSFPNRSARAPTTGASQESHRSARRENQPQTFLGHTHIRHQRKADKRNDRKSPEHDDSRECETDQVHGLAKRIDDLGEWMGVGRLMKMRRSAGMKSNPLMNTTTPRAARIRNGEYQSYISPSCKPAGTPNAGAMQRPTSGHRSSRPRCSSGKTSAMIVSPKPPRIPPKAP